VNPTREALKEIFLTAGAQTSRAYLCGRLLIWLFFLIWGFHLILTPLAEASRSVMHWVNLPFHEAGHIIFMPFGRLLQALGGTLLQLLMPLIVLGALLIQNRDAFGASIASWWLGQSFMDIAPYIDDARAGQLILLGGVTGRQAPGYHDWQSILGRLGWLEYDHLLACLSFYTGAVLMLVSFAWGGYILYLQFKSTGQDGSPAAE
jgi:hypothetical protein